MCQHWSFSWEHTTGQRFVFNNQCIAHFLVFAPDASLVTVLTIGDSLSEKSICSCLWHNSCELLNLFVPSFILQVYRIWVIVDIVHSRVMNYVAFMWMRRFKIKAWCAATCSLRLWNLVSFQECSFSASRPKFEKEKKRKLITNILVCVKISGQNKTSAQHSCTQEGIYYMCCMWLRHYS